MNMNPEQKKYREGRLPATAPLANPYVPFQLDDPMIYGPKEGLVRGTMFPGLDLPFKGMVNPLPRHDSEMRQLQEMAFGLQELALYLDTHPNDHEAYKSFCDYRKLYQKARDIYTEKCGPLTHMDVDGPEYNWLCDPWPWEFTANQEG